MQITDKNKISVINDTLKPYIHRTPVLSSYNINKLTSSKLFFKCENFQKTGSFKIRGAMNALLKLNLEQKMKGVVTHSSGNFAQALAYGAARLNISAKIVMPQNVIAAKRDAVISYGADVIYSGNNPEDREQKCNEVLKNSGSVFIHPSNDFNVISGHSSCALELIEDSEELDFIFCPVGGGGLISGISIGAHYFSPNTKIIGCEPEGADDAYKSFIAGKIIPVKNPNTIADGLKTSLGSITFPIIKQYVHEIITVSDEEIIYAMRLIWERLKIIAEPSASVSFAGFLKCKDNFKGSRSGIIISGGNIDLNNLPF